jgi:hypothetical protein
MHDHEIRDTLCNIMVAVQIGLNDAVGPAYMAYYGFGDGLSRNDVGRQLRRVQEELRKLATATSILSNVIDALEGHKPPASIDLSRMARHELP